MVVATERRGDLDDHVHFNLGAGVIRHVMHAESLSPPGAELVYDAVGGSDNATVDAIKSGLDRCGVLDGVVICRLGVQLWPVQTPAVIRWAASSHR